MNYQSMVPEYNGSRSTTKAPKHMPRKLEWIKIFYPLIFLLQERSQNAIILERENSQIAWNQTHAALVGGQCTTNPHTQVLPPPPPSNMQIKQSSFFPTYFSKVK